MRILKFAPEIEADRRRKGPGPEGRAQPPLPPPSGSSGGGSGGWIPSSSGTGSGSSLLPSLLSGCSGGGCLRLPLGVIIALVVLVVLFFVLGGGNLLGQMFGGLTDTGTLPNQSPLYFSDTTVPAGNYVPTPGFTPPAGSTFGNWTVMLYMDGDDEIIEQDIFTDFNEAERVGSTDQVNIVAQLDRYRGGFSGDRNWTSTRRYYLTQDNDLNTINSQLVSDMGELNMADPATLVDFATWAVQTFPADHYVLILSDHGMGWPGGWVDPAPPSSPTEQAPIADVVGNAIYLDQMDAAFGQIRQQTGIAKFDIIGLDACLMSQLEVLSVLEPHAQYAVMSEETEPSLGWAYTAFLQALTQNPSMSATDLSKLVVQSYISDDQRITDSQARSDFLAQTGMGFLSANQLTFELGKDSTLSAMDLSKVPALMSSMNDLAYAMESMDQSTVAGARSYALSFTSVFGNSVPPSYLDLGSFVQILAQGSGDPTIQQLSNQVLAKIQDAVIAEKHGGSKRGATGISIYFPNSKLYNSPISGPQSYTVVADRFSQDSLWDDFLGYHYNGRSFDLSSREAVIPGSNFPTRAPGLGQFTVSPLRLSSTTVSPGVPVTMRVDISGNNIGNIYYFAGYISQGSDAIWVADTDFMESPDTQQVDGVYYPQWGSGGDFTLKFDWDPYIFNISDGSTSDVALLNPQQYGATAADALYSVDGIYTFAASGDRLNARMNFRDGKMVNVIGITGQGDTGAPHEIIPQVDDTFVVLDKWLVLDSQGKISDTVLQESDTTLTFNGQPFTWLETYAAAGDYQIGFIVTDLDGNSEEVYGQVTVQ